MHDLELLNSRESTFYRQLIMHLRRYAQQVMLYLRYEISILIQRVSRIHHNNYKEAVKLHDKFKKKNSQDPRRRPINISKNREKKQTIIY